MTFHNYAAYLRRLNDTCAHALADAASLCETRAHRDIDVEHWLIKLLERSEGDLPVILRQYELDLDAIRNGLLCAIDRLPQDLRGKPGLSQRLGEWIKAAWLRVSLDAHAGTSVIRSAHLLAALAENPHLLRAPDAWPLLTVSAVQIERLLPEFDAVSPEARAQALTEEASTDPSRPYASDATSMDDATTTWPVIIARDGRTAKAHALQRFTTDITRKARDGRIDPVFGRDVEIRQMIDILVRRRKNNPILVGDPGVGKTALVEGLALKIACAV